MKKHRWLPILIILTWIVGCACSASAAELLPEEIRNRLAGTEITHSAFWDSPDSIWFVLVRTPDGTSILICFEQRDSKWVQSFHTSAAVPQGKPGIQMIHITDKVQDSVYNRTWQGPILMILTDDGSYTSYQRCGSGQWNLFKVFLFDEQCYLDFDDESIIYRTPIDQNQSRFETVYGSFERDLRKIDLKCIPRTPEQAQKMLDEMQSVTEESMNP